MTQTLSPIAAARLLGLSKQAVYSRIRRGTIPCVWVQGRPRIPRPALPHWFAWRAAGHYGLPPRKGEYTLLQAADALRLSHYTLWRYVQAGRLPAVRRGNIWYVRLGEAALPFGFAAPGKE